MTKREEMREGIKDIARRWFKPDGLASQTMPNDRSFEGDLLNYLHDNDVVIKVKCSDCEWSQFGEEHVGMTPCFSCNSTGYIIRPLIEE